MSEAIENAYVVEWWGPYTDEQLEEIEDRAEDVKQALLTIVAFLNEIELLDGDVEFWSALAEQ